MKKLKKDNIAIIIAVLLVVVYIFYECYSVTHIDLETQTALTSTVYEKIDAQALVVRDEHTIDNASDGVTVACLEDGAKINVGGNVAMVFSSTENATNYSQYAEIQDSLEYYENLESQTMGQAANVESLNNEINENINDYIRSINNSDIEESSSAASAVNDSLIRRQMVIGENIDFVSIIQNLRKQAEAFSSSSSKPDEYITTKESGVFSSYTDGYESIVDYDKIENISAQKLKQVLKTADSSNKKNSECLGKLITSYSWYFAAVVSSDCVSSISDGESVDVALKNNDDTILKAEIISGAEPEAGKKETVLILKCNNMDAQIASLRKENIEIRYDKYTGIKVPVDALHVVDGKKGVYALISSQVKFREAKVIYTEDDYVLLSYDPDEENGIRLYDKIITQGKDLEDGKVYT